MIIDEEGRRFITQLEAYVKRRNGESLEDFAVTPLWKGKLTWPVKWNPKTKMLESANP